MQHSETSSMFFYLATRSRQTRAGAKIFFDWLFCFLSFLLQTGGGIRHAVKKILFFPGRRKRKKTLAGPQQRIYGVVFVLCFIIRPYL